MLRTESYDAIVIGSGMGALTFAAVMSKVARKRVLVLERHFKAGGFTHTFRRPGGWEWDVGVHYVGGMGHDSMGRKLFDFITGGHVKWNPMPDDYDHFHYPGFRFNASKGKGKFEADLLARFPDEATSIRKYIRDLQSASNWARRIFIANSMPWPLAAATRWFNRITSALPLTTTGEYLDRHFRDPQLRALLASQWGDYGLPPSESAFAIHALIATHYCDGAFYPVGGSATIAEGASAIIRQAGGDVRVNHEVTRILVENGRATGVEVQIKKGKDGETVRFEAPLIVSNAGAATTFRKLLPANASFPFMTQLDALMQSAHSAATLYLGFKRDPRELGFRGENHWMFDTLDHDQALIRSADLLHGNAHAAYLSFPSLKDPRATRHTAEIIAPLSYQAVAQFRDLPWHRRGPEYDQIKQNIAKGMLDLAEQHHPGLTDLIEFQEVSTPLSIEHFTGHPLGGFYGIPATPERYRQSWLTPKTHVPGLFLAGVDSGSLGIMGALMGGVATASQVLGPFGFLRVMAAATRESRQPDTPICVALTTPPKAFYKLQNKST